MILGTNPQTGIGSQEGVFGGQRRQIGSETHRYSQGAMRQRSSIHLHHDKPLNSAKGFAWSRMGNAKQGQPQ